MTDESRKSFPASAADRPSPMTLAAATQSAGAMNRSQVDATSHLKASIGDLVMQLAVAHATIELLRADIMELRESREQLTLDSDLRRAALNDGRMEDSRHGQKETVANRPDLAHAKAAVETLGHA